ncbi:hypothetical protein ACET3Z_013929 [Daucus carota]
MVKGATYQVDLMIVQKMMTISEGNYAVTDAKGNIMFKVKSKVLSLRHLHVLLDAAGNPVVSFQKKIMSMLSTWKVYRGDSSDSKDLVFTMHKKHSFSSIVLKKDKFAVTVYPHIDYAFIVALVVILEEINEEGKNGGSASTSSGGGCGAS